MNIELEIIRLERTYEDALNNAGRLYGDLVVQLCKERDVQIERLRVIASRVKEFEV
jgi:hypothetical protein